MSKPKLETCYLQIKGVGIISVELTNREYETLNKIRPRLPELQGIAREGSQWLLNEKKREEELFKQVEKICKWLDVNVAREDIADFVMNEL